MNIIFDWSGTLADDHNVAWKNTNKTIEYFEGKTASFNIFKNEFGLPIDKFYSKYCPNVSMHSINKYYYNNYIPNSSGCKLFKGIPKLIQTLNTNNTLYILSTLDLEILNALSKDTGIFNYFKKI